MRRWWARWWLRKQLGDRFNRDWAAIHFKELIRFWRARHWSGFVPRNCRVQFPFFVGHFAGVIGNGLGKDSEVSHRGFGEIESLPDPGRPGQRAIADQC